MGSSMLAIALLLCVYFTALCEGAFEVRHLIRTFKLFSGRASACPGSVSYGPGISSSMTLPASSMQADGSKCTGPGGKVLRSGSVLRNSGVPLPSILGAEKVRFFAGVESATRVCGGHAFNATAISYFVTSTEQIVDKPSALTLQPGKVYAIYSHFAHLCVYRAVLSQKERNQLELPALRGSVQADGGPVSSLGEELPVRQPACFPANGIVQTRTRAMYLSELKVGDEVAVAPGIYSRIYTFSHRDANAKARFVRITTESGMSLDLTPGHLIYVKERPEAIAASNVSVGDTLRVSDGSLSTVRSIRSVTSTGLYAPHSIQGDIIVNDLIASCYTDHVDPSAAHALLAPLRALQLPAPLADFIFDSFRQILPTSI